jgi:hypothetical protein
VFVCYSGQPANYNTIRAFILEFVQPLLPPTVALDTNFDASKNHLFSATKVYSELDDITILYPEGLRLDVRLAQSYVIEKRPRRAFHVFDVPAAVFAPQLTVFPAHNLGLEAYRRRRGHAR